MSKHSKGTPSSNIINLPKHNQGRGKKPNIINLPKKSHRISDDAGSDSTSSDSSCYSPPLSPQSTTRATPGYDPVIQYGDIIHIQNKCPLDIDDEDQIQAENIHIRVQQRRANSYITTVQGLSSKLDLKVILRALKHGLHCNGTITKDPEHGNIIQLSGDQRDRVKSFLIDEGICEKNQIIMHGF
jgi:translation initiation factor 1